MAAGWQIGAKCLPSIELAATQACAQAFGMTNAGLLSCTGYSIDGDVVALSFSDASTASVIPQPCDRMTYADTWGPLFVAIALMLLALWCAKLLINMFMSGSDHV